MTGPRALPPGEAAGWSLIAVVLSASALLVAAIGGAAYGIYNVYKEIRNGL